MTDDAPWSKLRKQLHEQRTVIAALEDTRVRLQTENDKLRAELDQHADAVRQTYRAWCGRDLMHLPLPEAVGAVIAELRGRIDSRQAHIDALMLEYCPSEMSDEQRARWVASQRAVARGDALPVDPLGRLVPNYGGADPLASRMQTEDDKDPQA